MLNKLLLLMSETIADDSQSNSTHFIVALLLFTIVYIALSVLFVFWSKKTKNTSTISTLDKIRNIATPIFFLICLGCATYLNVDILTSIISTTTVRSAIAILARYSDVLFNGSALSVTCLICSSIILVTYIIVTFYSQLSSIFVFLVNKRKRTLSIFADGKLNITSKLNANVSMILSKDDLNKASTKEKLRIMSDIYIQKRLTILIENSNNDGKPLIEGNSIPQEKLELKKQFTFIAGEPGVGKSMFFIHLLSNYILKKSDDLVIYYDLAQYQSDCKYIKCSESDLLTVLNNYVSNLYLNKECNDQNSSFLKKIFKTSKNVIVILDSIDECHSEDIDAYIYEAFSGIDNVKVMIGTRYAYLLKCYSSILFRTMEKQLFLINGYNPKEWTTYVNTVVDKSFVEDEDEKEQIKERINKDISVMFYSEYLNPFMLRAIAQNRINGDVREKDSPYSIISEMIESIENSKNEKIKLSSPEGSKHSKTLDIIGALSNLKSSEILKYKKTLRSLLEWEESYDSEAKKLKDKRIIPDVEKENFSSGVLADFYAADCLLAIAKETRDVPTKRFKAKTFIDDTLLGDLFEDHYDSIIQFLMLIADRNIDDFDVILSMLKETTSENGIGRKDNINKFVFTACEGIFRFTAPRIKRDEKPITGRIFEHDKELMQKLFGFFLFAMKDNYVNMDRSIFYNDIYRLLTIYGYHKEALETINDIEDLHGFIYEFVSIVRDSYEACFFNENNYFDVSRETLIKILSSDFKILNIDEKTAKPTLIRYLLDLKFLSNLTSEADLLNEIKGVKIKCSEFLKKAFNGKIPHYFPYIFDLSYYSYDFNYDQNELFSDNNLSFRDSKSFVVLDIDESHSFETSSLLSSLFITNSGSLSLEKKSEIFNVNSSEITSLMISSQISEIAPYQFHHCEKLRYVHLFDGLKRINDFAFIGCQRIEKLFVPDSVYELGESFIEDAFSLKSIHLPKHFVIGNYSFEECCSLETITGGQAEKLSDGIFQGCSSLVDFNFEMFSDVKEIPDVAFAYCGYREKIDLTVFNQLESVGNLVFSGDEIDEIVFPESLKTLKMNVFYQSSIKRIVFKGQNKINISELTFKDMDSFKTTIIEYKGKEFSVDSFLKECNVNVLDTEVNGVYGSLKNGVYTIFSSKNVDNPEFDDLNLDDYVKEEYTSLDFRIGCFGNHEYIQSVSAKSEKIKSLSRYMFEDNISLTEIDFEDAKIEDFNACCFTGCLSLKRVVLSEKTKIIDKQAFFMCPKVKLFSYGKEKCQENAIILGESLELIGDSAFWGMENIETIIIKSNKVRVKSHAFSNMKKLKTVYLPEGYDINVLFENDVFDGNQIVDVFIGKDKLVNGNQGSRIGAFSSAIIEQGSYPCTVVGNKKDDKEGLRLRGLLEEYFDGLSEEQRDAIKHNLDYYDGEGDHVSDAHYWDIDYVDKRFGGKYSGKYRRLFFKKYRSPEYGKKLSEITNENSFFQQINGYEINKAYWFKFEPLTWKYIGNNSRGEKQYLSEFVIDSMEFNQTTVKIDGKPANLFGVSTTKKWMDEELKKYVLLNPERNRIITKNEEFRLAPIGKEEYERLKGIFSLLKAKATNYASSQGTYNYTGDWAAYFLDWPDENNEDCELYIKPDGIKYSGAVPGRNTDNFVIRTDGGVRPVLTVTKKV